MQRKDHASIPIYHGNPWSPYFVFIRRKDLSDQDILARLGMSGFTQVRKFNTKVKYIAIGHDSSWIHIADNYWYSHWHSESFRNKIQMMAKESDVFSFSVGDADWSFDFELYQNGELARRFVWDDPNYDGGHLKEEIGTPIKGEDAIEKGKEKDPMSGLWKLAALQGIETDYTRVCPKLYGDSKYQSRPFGWLRSLMGK